MARTYYSIFNDALGPVMTGPSSSHSAGCAHIGLTARGLIGREITHADVIFEQQGSYPSTYIGQGSSYGFTGGLMGWAADDPRLKDAVTIAAAEGRCISFRKANLGFLHPNQALIRVYDESGGIEMSLMTFSVGGGMFRITEMDGFSVLIEGGDLQVFILCQAAAQPAIMQKLADLGFDPAEQTSEGRCLLTVKPAHGADTAVLKELEAMVGVLYVRFAWPVMPVVKRQDQDPPFFNAEEALAYARKTGKSLWQLALDYECGYGHVTELEIEALVGRVRQAMAASTVAPDPNSTPVYGFLPYSCRNMEQNADRTRQIDAGLLTGAMQAAIAVMENSCAHNIVVAAPTAGSSGVVPASVVYTGMQMGLLREEIDRALLAAGLVGVFIANQATFGAEVGGCQAENGSASAMAAAGVVQLLGGTAEQAFAAASLSLQNMLGLVCDPIAGLTEIPCISRNVAAMSNAVLSANMVLLGFDPVIPLDETIRTMGRIGADIPAELRCTCRGGLCHTPTGCRLDAQINAARPSLSLLPPNSMVLA